MEFLVLIKSSVALFGLTKGEKGNKNYKTKTSNKEKIIAFVLKIELNCHKTSKFLPVYRMMHKPFPR